MQEDALGSAAVVRGDPSSRSIPAQAGDTRGVVKKSIDDIDFRSKHVLARLDLNVPLDDTGRITDDRRIRAVIPTISKLLDGGARLILMSHLGRPKGPEDYARLSLRPIAVRLSELIRRPVTMLDNPPTPLAKGGKGVRDVAAEAVRGIAAGDVILLENLRFHKEETIKDKDARNDPALQEAKRAFARRLAEMADVYVNDAFGTCHRDNASMLTVPSLMKGKPRVVGYLVQKELRFLGAALANPDRPFVCVLGGAKVSDKLGAICALLQRCDRILVGGAMAYTFLAAKGVGIGKSLVEKDLIPTARELLEAHATKRIMLPTDSVVTDQPEQGAQADVVVGDIPAELMGVDIGPQTRERYHEQLAKARTIVWNGPMGVFEVPPFDQGTVAIARAIADATDNGATSVVGGGDSAAAVVAAGVADRITHISTGGGASLEFLEGKPFAAIDILDDA